VKIAYFLDYCGDRKCRFGHFSYDTVDCGGEWMSPFFSVELLSFFGLYGMDILGWDHILGESLLVGPTPFQNIQNIIELIGIRCIFVDKFSNHCHTNVRAVERALNFESLLDHDHKKFLKLHANSDGMSGILVQRITIEVDEGVLLHSFLLVVDLENKKYALCDSWYMVKNMACRDIGMLYSTDHFSTKM